MVLTLQMKHLKLTLVGIITALVLILTWPKVQGFSYDEFGPGTLPENYIDLFNLTGQVNADLCCI